MRKRTVYIVTACLFLALLYGLVKQLTDSLKAGRRLEMEMEELSRLQQKNTELRKRLAAVESSQFIEKVARDKLNLARPGETMVIISQEEIDKVLYPKREVTPIPLSNWQGWLKLFWH